MDKQPTSAELIKRLLEASLAKSPELKAKQARLLEILRANAQQPKIDPKTDS